MAVSIHASARDATDRTSAILIILKFQSTRPRGTRLSKPRKMPAPPSFNPRVREGRDRCERRRCQEPSGFNPRVREGRDASQFLPREGNSVSIHASARDATRRLLRAECPVIVSIHASARDATVPPQEPEQNPQFQSTRPRGTRHRAVPEARTHRRFNPRVREGRDAEAAQ